jgi:hypothetical protein
MALCAVAYFAAIVGRDSIGERDWLAIVATIWAILLPAQTYFLILWLAMHALSLNNHVRLFWRVFLP